MATKKETVSVKAKDLSAEVKDLLIKKAHSIFEREPAPAFVGRNLDLLVAEIISLF